MDNLLFKSGNSGQVNIDQAQGIVECFVAGIGNKDSVGDVVISGAFAKSLLRRKPRVVWGHSWNDPIGKVLEMYEVPVGDSRLPAKMRNAGIGGLYAKVQFNLNSEKGKEAFATVAFFGEEQEWSIGYKTIDSVFDPNLQANILKEVELYEVSPVLHGANQLTGTISIKADEKGQMPIIPMHGMGMPGMPQVPRIVVVAAPQDGADESSEGDPFAEGMSQELSEPDKNALQAELAERTGSKIEIMNATENSVVFRRTTTDGQASMYRLPYHREGNQYMFGKPEPYAVEQPKPQPMQNIEQKPGAPVVVPNGGIAYRNDDQQEMIGIFGATDQNPYGKSEISHLIELPEAYMASAKDFLTPVLRHHKLVGRPNAKGIVVDGTLTANALDALQNAVKALGATIGQASGNIGQAIGKIRDLAQTFNPYALDGDGDGFVQDGSPFMRPFVPVKKPGFDLPDVRGRKRSGDALLDKPRSAPKLPKDKKTWTRAQRNDALAAGVIEPETREDVAYLSNRRPDNEGLAKYWDMSQADLTKEGNRLVNARSQATGSEKNNIDEELLKISHEFQRRASYAETFGQEFVPPAKRETPAEMVPEADKPKPAKPKRSKEEGFASAQKIFDSFNSDEIENGEEYKNWDDLDDDQKTEFINEVNYDYMYDQHGGLGDDGIVEALENGDYDDEIEEHAEEVYDKIKAERIKKREEDDLRAEREDERAYAESEAGRADEAEAERIAEEDAADYAREVEEERELAERRRERDLDERADAALDRALEGYIERYGEEGLASRGRVGRARDYVRRRLQEVEDRQEPDFFDSRRTEALPLPRDRRPSTGIGRDSVYTEPSYPDWDADGSAAKAFDKVLEKYWKMWGFDVPGDDEEGWDEPFGFASRGNDEEVKQSKLDELVSGVKDRLIAELETADPSTWKPSWRSDSLPINPTTGKPYRGMNAFFLMLAAADRKYNTGRFAGFNQLKARGAIVRKGEKGIPILRPQLVKKEDDDGNVKEFVVFRGATVFNIDQTDGGDEALRAIPADLPESERIAILDETLKELGVVVQTADMTPHYSPDGDYISMPDFAKGTSALEWTSTLAHEAVHWTGHSSRLKRASLAEYSSDKKVRAYEELVAEIGSAMVLAAHGIEAPFRQDHAPYIKGWIQLLKDDPEALNRAFKDAQAAVNFMLEKSPNLRKLFGGIDTGKKAPDVDAPVKVDVPVGASEGFASLHRIRTPGSSAIGGILYDDMSRELMVGFLKGKSWDDLSDEEREDFILKRGTIASDSGRAYSDTEINDRAKELYEDSRDIGWYVYSDVSMEEVQELAAVKSKGKHINALKKLKKARKATDEDNFNFFGRDERAQDVAKAKPVDGLASRGGPLKPRTPGKRLGVEPRYQDRDWVNQTQERILRQNTDFESLSDDDKIDWANSLLGDYLNENEMGHNLTDVANGNRLNTRPDMDLLNYAEEAYAAMSDAHMARRAQFGRDEDGFASVGSRTRRLGVKPSQAVDYVSYDPDGENLFVAYKREDGRGDMYVYEGVSMDDAIGVENAESVGRAINDIKRRKNVRKATPEEVIGLSNADNLEQLRSIDSAMKSRKLDVIQQSIHGDDRFGLGKRESRIDEDGRLVIAEGSEAEGEQRLVVDWNPATGRYEVSVERWSSGDDVTPSGWETVQSLTPFFDDGDGSIVREELLELNRKRELELDADARIERELEEARRELDMAGDAPGVESVDVTYSSALDAVDYNPSTQELRVTYKDGGTYIYEGVDRDTFEGFKGATSKGRAMNDIKRAHPFRKDSEWAGGRDEDGGIEEFDVRGSGAVEKVTYDPDKEELTVVYSGGKGYVYSGVTREEADAVRSAPSKGRAINDVKRTHDVRKVSAEDKGKDTPKPTESTDSDFPLGPPAPLTASDPPVLIEKLTGRGEANQYLRIARSIADQIVNNPESGVEDPAFDRRSRGLYYPEWDVVPDWLKEEQTKWMNENKPKASGAYTTDEVGEMFNAVRELLMNTGIKGAPRKVTSGRKIPKSDLDRFEKESSDGLFDMMRKTYDSFLMSNDYDKEKAARQFAEMFGGNTIEFVSDSAVLSGDVPIVDADGDRIDPQGYKIRPVKGFDNYERVIPAGSDVGAASIDPAPVAKPKMPTRKPPRGGKRVRNRNVTITMEQGALDEIIEAEGNGTTVDALRAARGVGKYTKGPRKGKRRGPDTIAVRDAETGELLHANEIELTSSSANWYEGRKQGQSPTGRKRGYIRARSYAGRQGHNVVSDEGPNLRGEGRGMTDYDKRVYGLGSDEKNREAGLASSGVFMDDGIRLMRRGNRDFLSEQFSSREYRDAMSGLDKVRNNSGEELTTEESRAIRKLANLYLESPATRGTQREAINDIVNMVNDYRSGRGLRDGFASRGDDPSANLVPKQYAQYGNFSYDDLVDDLQSYFGYDQDGAERIADHWKQNDAIWDDYFEDAINNEEGDLRRAFSRAAQTAYEDYIEDYIMGRDEGFASRGSTTRRRGVGMQNFDYRDYESDAAREIQKDLMGRKNQNLGEEIVMMDDGNGNMVPTAVHWGSRPNSEGVAAANDWVFDFVPKGEWMEVGVGESSAVKRVWIKRNNAVGGPGRGTGNDRGYSGNEVMVMFNNGRIYAYNDVIRPNLIGLLDAESMGRAVREITHPDGEASKDFTRIDSLADALKMVRGSYSGDRGEAGYYTDYPRGEESSYEDYVAKLYEEADAALESGSVADYRDTKRILVEEGRLLGGPGDSSEDIEQAHREHYLETFGLSEEEWQGARPATTDGDGFASTYAKPKYAAGKRSVYEDYSDLPEVRNQPNSVNAWELLAPSTGARGREGNYKQWNVTIVKNPNGTYDVVKQWGKLGDGDAYFDLRQREGASAGALADRGMSGTTQTSFIDQGVRDYKQARSIALRAVRDKLVSGSGYRLTATNDKGRRRTEDMGRLRPLEGRVGAIRERRIEDDQRRLRDSLAVGGDGFASRSELDNMDIVVGDKEFEDLTQEELAKVSERLDESLKPGRRSYYEGESYRQLRNFYQRRLDFARAGEEIESEYEWRVEKLDDGSIRWTTGSPEGEDLENNGDVGFVGTITRRPDGKYESSWYTQTRSNMSSGNGWDDPGDSGDVEEVNSGGGVFDTLEEAAENAYDDGVGEYGGDTGPDIDPRDIEYLGRGRYRERPYGDGFASRGRDLDWEETERGSGTWNAVGNNPRAFRGDSIYTITRDEDGKFGVDAAHGYSYQRDGGTDYTEEYFDETFDTLDEAKEFVRRIDDSREGEGDDYGDDGFASRSGVIQPNEMPKKPLVVQEEWIDFDELDTEAQDRIIQGSDKDRDTTIEQWDDDARAARAEAAESLLKEIDDLWRKDADADNPFQRNGNLAYAEELIKNTDYVSSFDLAEAQNIVDDVRERFNSRPQEPQQFYLDWDELSDVRKARVKEEYVEFLKGAGDPAGLSPDQITDGELEDFYAENVEIFDFYGTSIGDDGFASRGAGTPTKTSLRKAATEKRAEIRSLIADQDMLDRENPMERRAYNDMEKRIEDAQAELRDLERQIDGLPPRGDTGRPMPGEGLASRMTQADVNDAVADTANYPDEYEADMANMAAQDVANNFARLSTEDQNMYFQRALANNADSGMTTEQIVEEAKKLAMDDRRMAELERQSIGMGQSSKPRKIDVSSSSALNSVEYDEMNRRLSVEYRGRDGKGTGTVYTYDGVEPDVVDRIEASDSRGATMREIRDNYEFTTSRKLPDSAYEGLASRGDAAEAERVKSLPVRGEGASLSWELTESTGIVSANGAHRDTHYMITPPLSREFTDKRGMEPDIYYHVQEPEGSNGYRDTRHLGRSETLDGAKQIAQDAEDARVRRTKQKEVVDISDLINRYRKERGETDKSRLAAVRQLGYSIRDLNKNGKVIQFNYNGKLRTVDIDASMYSGSKYDYQSGGSGIKLAGFDRESNGDRTFFISKLEPTSNVRERAPDSDSGFASRGANDYKFSPEDSQKILDRVRGTQEFQDLNEIQEMLDGYVARGRTRRSMPDLDKREVAANKAFVAKRAEIIEEMIAEGEVTPTDQGDGFASRGGRKSTAEYRDMLDELPAGDLRAPSEMGRGRFFAPERYSPSNDNGARNATKDRYALIHARRQIAREMADANGVPFNPSTAIYDVSDDQDDIDILEELDRRIDALNELQTFRDREFLSARQDEQVALTRQGEAQDFVEYSQSLIDDDDQKNSAIDLLSDIQYSFGDEYFGAGSSRRDGGGGIHPSSKEISEKIKQARKLLESDDPEDTRSAIGLIREIADNYSEKFNADYYKAEAKQEELIDRGYRPVSVDDIEDFDLEDWDEWQEFVEDTGDNLSYIEDALYGPSQEELEMSVKYPRRRLRESDADGFASGDGSDLPLGLTRDDLVQYLWQGDPNENWEEAEAIADNWMNSNARQRGGYIDAANANRRNDSFPATNDRTRTIRSLLEAARRAYSEKRPESEGFASRGSRRRPGRRNQGGRGETMAPRRPWSAEDRQRFADGDRLRGRARPGKRRGGPDASEWDGFASTTDVDQAPDVAIDPRGIFEGGEHGPGKDISLRVMWNNIRRSGENNEWFEEGVTADDLAERLGVSRGIAQGLLDARPQSGGPEKFIDDPYLADRISRNIGISPARLFGFDPVQYFDESGRVPVEDEDIDAAIAMERARRAARVAAREGRRTGKASLYRNEGGDMDVRILEDKLNVKLTDENGNLLNEGGLHRATRDTGLGWGLEKWRRISSRGGALTPLDIEELVDKGILDQDALPSRNDLSFGEVFQWPGFSEFGSSQIIDALTETLGLDRAEIMRQRRSIQEALTLAKNGKRKKVATRNLQQAKLKLTRAKIAELVERLGLDASEFERWFGGE